jgi:hypothetical protein
MKNSLYERRRETSLGDKIVTVISVLFLMLALIGFLFFYGVIS